MRKIDELMKNLQFGFSEVDATLNGWEMLAITGIGIVIFSFLFIGGV